METQIQNKKEIRLEREINKEIEDDYLNMYYTLLLDSKLKKMKLKIPKEFNRKYLKDQFKIASTLLDKATKEKLQKVAKSFIEIDIQIIKQMKKEHQDKFYYVDNIKLE